MTPYRTPPPSPEWHWFWRDAIIRRESGPSAFTTVLATVCMCLLIFFWPPPDPSTLSEALADALLVVHDALVASQQPEPDKPDASAPHPLPAYPVVPPTGQNLPVGDLTLIDPAPFTTQRNDGGTMPRDCEMHYEWHCEKGSTP